MVLEEFLGLAPLFAGHPSVDHRDDIAFSGEHLNCALEVLERVPVLGEDDERPGIVVGIELRLFFLDELGNFIPFSIMT